MGRRRRPVGERVAKATRNARLPHWTDGFAMRFLSSGSEALALALVALKRKSDENRKFVIIPGYCCPDIVSAIEFAGLCPFIVDTGKNSPFIDISRMEEVLDESVLAICSCHFLGIRDHTRDLLGAASSVGATVIEDSAQFVPGRQRDMPIADIVIYSFGRGKPISALGGGLLLVKGPLAKDIDEIPVQLEKKRVWNSASVLEIRRLCYNLAIKDFSYDLLSRINPLEIGKVKKRTLRSLSAVNKSKYRMSVSGIQSFNSAITSSQAIFDVWLENKKSMCRVEDRPSYDTKLLRYPILCRTKRDRDKLKSVLDSGGAGASVMYETTVDHFCCDDSYKSTELDNAKDFANRLLTLPVYSDLSPIHANEIIKMLNE